MDDARRLMLMVCSATASTSLYLTGDPSTGILRTAKTMERPMELPVHARAKPLVVDPQQHPPTISSIRPR